MITCFCCERREVLEVHECCKCTSAFCATCIFCSEHCCCLHSDPTFVMDDQTETVHRYLYDRHEPLLSNELNPYRYDMIYDPGISADQPVVVDAR